jgi:thioredoxin-related protein
LVYGKDSMTTRRNLVFGASAAALAVLAGSRARADEPILTDDGLYKQPWYLESFLDLAEDLEDARKQGKRFVLAWELRGCPYCKETHLVNFAQERISDYVRSNFVVLQLNIVGSRKVTDFDGAELTEKALAAKYGVRFTPTFQFFPEMARGLKDLSPTKREVARMPGYLRPDDFLAMFRYVRENAYETKSFLDFLKANS